MPSLVNLVIFLFWVGPVPYSELFWAGPVKKVTLYKFNVKVDGGDEPQEGGEERRRIHGNSAEFQHLEQHDMDQLCARVVLTGFKPQ